MSEAQEIAAALPLGAGVRVVCVHDSGIVALDKPAGLPAHPNAGDASGGALLKAPYNDAGEFYFFKRNEKTDTRIFLLNRIDSPTSGLILIATNEAVAGAVKKLFREKEISKTYFAAVKGARVFPEKGVWRDLLLTAREGGSVRTRTGKSGAPAISEFRRIAGDKENLGISLLKLMPKTGRTHQLRVQCASRGLPVAGDQTYGDFAFNRLAGKTLGTKRMFLHSSVIEFEFLFNGAPVKFSATSALPAEFQKLFGDISGEKKSPAAGSVKISGNLSVRVNLRRQ